MLERFLNWLTFKRGLAIVSFVVLAAVAGVIGNRFDAITLHMWENKSERIADILSSWQAITIILLVFLVVILAIIVVFTWLYYGSALKGSIARSSQNDTTLGKEIETLQAAIRVLNDENTTLQKSSDTLAELAQLDGNLLRECRELIHAQDRSVELQELLGTFLAGCEAIINNGTIRGMVLAPEQGSRYLVPIAVHKMTMLGQDITADNEPDPGQRVEFYIGGYPTGSTPKQRKKLDNERGIAGLVYDSGHQQIVHANPPGSRHVTDKESDYRRFPWEIAGNLPFQSMAVVPVGFSARTVAVLCLDSNYAEIFDRDLMTFMLKALALRLACLLSLHRRLQEREQALTQSGGAAG